MVGNEKKNVWLSRLSQSLNSRWSDGKKKGGSKKKVDYRSIMMGAKQEIVGKKSAGRQLEVKRGDQSCYAQRGHKHEGNRPRKRTKRKKQKG